MTMLFEDTYLTDFQYGPPAHKKSFLFTYPQCDIFN